MAEGRGFLDLVIPIESKYTVVTTEHVTYFDDKVRKVFGDARNVLPIMVGLSWKPDAMALAKRFGFMTLYFSSIQNLLRALTGTEYSLEGEWKRVEEMLNRGEITLEELRRRINDLEIKYEFEELLEKRIGRRLGAKVSRKTPAPYSASKQKVGEPMPVPKPMLAVAARSIEEILSQHPMLAWEYKLDGIRVLAKKETGRVRLYSRNGKDLTDKFPDVAEEVAKGFDEDEWIIDGELVAKNDDGRWLPPQKLRHEGNGNWKYFVFDVLSLNGEDLTDYSYEERRQVLESKTLGNSKVQVVPRIVSSSKVEVEEFFTQAKAKGHEGVVAKAIASPYKTGRSHRYWFKFKGEPDTLDLVVVGYNYGKGGGIKSLLLATRKDGKFFTVGKVGSGISRRDRKMLKEMLDECAVKVRPTNVVSSEFPDVWVEPKIVVEISYEGVIESEKHSSGYSLRFPRFVRVREDKKVSEVTLI